MAINAYTGLMGSGKSYEVVSNVIVPAVLAGRRVVTNIDGINPEEIYAYCKDVGKGHAKGLGDVIPVKNADIRKDGFFPDETRLEVESFVKAGDLVAIDEAWEFWSAEKKITPEHMRFFRMHRHYVHAETGVSCDVALMIQSITDLHRQLRSVIEITFVTKKLKVLGQNRRYRIEMYSGAKLTKAAQISIDITTYKPAIFPLYQSYAGGKGNERAIDARHNILRSPKVWIKVAIYAACSIGSGWYCWRYFHPQTAAETSANQVASAEPHVTPDGAPYPTPTPVPIPSERWRVAGHYSVAGERHVVLSDSSGRIRIASASGFRNLGLTIVGEVDGQQVTAWSGQRPASRFLGETP
ncbi:Zonular occludens toxin [Pandoraea horticolens]|uniref:Zonular occludens toxin n=1 Tax=Pandoraea horticolens TaxID=2508298 RepID=A0A5E4WY48_9BURK|nr:zonular occludens toxin domain-containing protein [Pandoraea horticolens]VVE28800.1 Zonular occludens toxin [Pandoraea horticolens]